MRAMRAPLNSSSGEQDEIQGLEDDARGAVPARRFQPAAQIVLPGQGEMRDSVYPLFCLRPLTANTGYRFAEGVLEDNVTKNKPALTRITKAR